MASKEEEERARRIKRKRKKRALKNNLAKDLKGKEGKRESQRIKDKHRNRYEDMAVIFISTLVIGYIILYLANFFFNFFFGQVLAVLGVSTSLIFNMFHAAVWLIAIFSAYTGRSVLDDLFDRFA